MGEITVIDTMTEAQARACIGNINRLSAEIGRLLTELRDREGWRALGYQSWTAFLESDELSYSRKRLYEFMRAFPVTERLRGKGYELNTDQANALAKYPEDLQVVIYETVANSGKPVTADRLIARGEVYTEMVATGGLVTTRSGEQSAAESAYASQREQQEISKRESRTITEATAWVNPTGDYLYIEDQPDVWAVLRAFWRQHQTDAKVRLIIQVAA